jgi:hypothetical protein
MAFFMLLNALNLPKSGSISVPSGLAANETQSDLNRLVVGLRMPAFLYQ